MFDWLIREEINPLGDATPPAAHLHNNTHSLLAASLQTFAEAA
jgi:hypothetical protein